MTYDSCRLPFSIAWLLISAACCLTTLAGAVRADEYRLEPLADSAPSDAVSPEIAKLLQPHGVKVIKGTSRSLCKIWLCKQLPLDQDAAGKPYPFPQGAIVGVIQYERDGGDFRDQEIPKGVYTMRYARIPTDGNHEGVSPTPDFVLLVSAENDADPGPVAIEQLQEQSADSIGSSHPAILALKSPMGDAVPALVHDEDEDWWLVQLQAKTTSGKPVRISLVVVGYTEE